MLNIYILIRRRSSSTCFYSVVQASDRAACGLIKWMYIHYCIKIVTPLCIENDIETIYHFFFHKMQNPWSTIQHMHAYVIARIVDITGLNIYKMYRKIDAQYEETKYSLRIIGFNIYKIMYCVYITLFSHQIKKGIQAQHVMIWQ
ncbi:hypothetical protein ACJX0J_024358, partial [Zea mays]